MGELIEKNEYGHIPAHAFTFATQKCSNKECCRQVNTLFIKAV